MVTDLIYIAGFIFVCLLPIGLIAKRFRQVERQWLLLIFVVWLGALIAIDDILWDARTDSSPIGSLARLFSDVLFN